MRFDILSRCFTDVLYFVWGEWNTLYLNPSPNRLLTPEISAEWETFKESMGEMCESTFLHPAWFDEPKMFGNHWTI